MKKLILVVLTLILCFSLATPAFADLIIPPDIAVPEEETVIPEGSGIAEGAASAEAASASANDSPTWLYLVIGVLVLAASFLLFALLRKPKKCTASSWPVS